MRTARLAAAAALAATAVALPASAQQSKSIKDWLVGCDNARTCTALGLAPEDPGTAYLKILRDGAASAEPTVTVAAWPENDAKPGMRLKLAFDDPAAGGVPAGPLAGSVDADDSYVRATLSGADARAFIAGLRKANRLAVTILGPDGKADPQVGTVSLSGAVGALLFVDEVQQRLGTETALIRAGPKPASAVPPVPALPVLTAVAMRELAGVPPKALKLPSAEDSGCPEGVEPIGLALGGKLEMWGGCVSAGAYNFTYDFVFLEGGKTRPAAFELPAGQAADAPDDPGGLTNPAVGDDHKTITAFAKGRGLGDCGTLASWAFDGTRFRVVSYAAMDDCRGVPPDDWPVLWRAEVK
jgi:hypothetical protein